MSLFSSKLALEEICHVTGYDFAEQVCVIAPLVSGDDDALPV
jgi:hypothetical protein